MGNEASSLEQPDDYPEEFAKFDGIETLGYRVLGVQPDSPASAAGLVSFLDFLVGCNGEMLLGSGEGLEEGDEYDDIDFPALLKDNVGKELELLVHNIKSNSQRLVKITPSTTWGGAGLLGVTIRLDDYGGADERLIRVLSVEHNSPAAIAGLVPEKDYLLGTTSTSFNSDTDLAEVLTVHADRIVELYVYSSESDVVRVVTLMPTLSWGGRGLLGAEVGTGYLHRFPSRVRDTDGESVERKIRMGVRPTEKVSALQKSREGAEIGEKKEEPPEGEGGGEMVDLTALTDAVSGQAMCFAEQMEMEPEPEPSVVSVSLSEQTPGEEEGESAQAPSQPSAEIGTAPTNGRSAASVFDSPPPGDGIFAKSANGMTDLPPPPQQVAASGDVDLR